MKIQKFLLVLLIPAALMLLCSYARSSPASTGRTPGFDESKYSEISVDFRGVHIRSALMKISELAGLNIIIDEAAIPTGKGELLPGGISPRVTLRLEDVPALDALNAMLRMKNLAYQIHRNIVIITSGERRLSEGLETRMYILDSPATGPVEFKMPDWELEEADDRPSRVTFPD